MIKPFTPEEVAIGLTDVRALYSSEDKWTKGWFARYRDGQSCSAYNPEASCWCLDGALLLIGKRRFGSAPGCTAFVDQMGEALDEAVEVLGLWPRNYISLNDREETTFDVVCRVVDKAIEIQRAAA